jgi:hypothetical protein
MHGIFEGKNIQGKKLKGQNFRAKSKNPITKEGLVPKVQWKL